MPPAWYPDPAAAGWLRWWDGYAWTTAVRPADVPVALPVTGWTTREAAQAELGEESAAARTASRAIWFGVAAYAVVYFVFAVTGHREWSHLRAYLHAASHYDGTGTAPEPPSPFAYGGVWTYAAELVLLIVGILFAIWLRRAAGLARRAGLPAKRSPGWAFFGFILPVVNYWFPYQLARDIFPPGHPGRRLAGRWWTLWVISTLAGIPVYVSAIFSTPLAIVFAAVAAGIAGWAGFAARTMVAACGPVHAGLLGH